MVGAFRSRGVVVGLGQPYITHTLHGGNAGWGVVFAAIFVGWPADVPRPAHPQRFQQAAAVRPEYRQPAIPLALIALIPNLVVTVVLVVLLGACAGVAYRHRLHDRRTRGRRQHEGRTFRVPVLGYPGHPVRGDRGGAVRRGRFTAVVRGVSGTGNLRIGHVSYQGIGYNCVMLLAAAIAVWVGVISYRQMDDRRGVPLRDDLVSAVRGEEVPVRARAP